MGVDPGERACARVHGAVGGVDGADRWHCSGAEVGAQRRGGVTGDRRPWLGFHATESDAAWPGGHEVALAVVLLAGAGLLLTSLARLQAVSPGFSADGVLVARLTLAGPTYQDRAAMVRFYDNVLNQLRETPGVVAAGAAGALPLSGSANTSHFRIPGRPAAPDGQGPTSRWSG